MSEAPDKAEIVALPPVIFAGFLLFGLLVNRFWPTPWLGAGAGSAAGYALIALAVALAGSAVWAMKRHQTTIDPRGATTALVSGGPFRFTRNPLYVSLALLNLAAACFADSLIMLALTVPLVIVLQQGVIRPEERYLERKFGEAYRQYQTRVRRWL